MSKAYLLVICLLSASLTGCLGGEDDDDEIIIDPIVSKPTATIVSINPNPANLTSLENIGVTFVGNGETKNGYILEYDWGSSIDGFLSSEKTFTTKNLSLGEHTIFFKVLNDEKVWSDKATTTLQVINHTENSEEEIIQDWDFFPIDGLDHKFIQGGENQVALGVANLGNQTEKFTVYLDIWAFTTDSFGLIEKETPDGERQMVWDLWQQCEAIRIDSGVEGWLHFDEYSGGGERVSFSLEPDQVQILILEHGGNNSSCADDLFAGVIMHFKISAHTHHNSYFEDNQRKNFIYNFTPVDSGAKVEIGDTAHVHYAGFLESNGRLFDTSIDNVWDNYDYFMEGTTDANRHTDTLTVNNIGCYYESTNDGVILSYVDPSFSAYEGGLRTGMEIYEIEGQKINTYDDFLDAMNVTVANQTIEISVVNETAGLDIYTVKMTDLGEFYLEYYPVYYYPWMDGKGFMGINAQEKSALNSENCQGSRGMILGFDQGMLGMYVGQTLYVVIPPEDAYGTNPDGHSLGGETLIFSIRIVSVEEKVEARAIVSTEGSTEVTMVNGEQVAFNFSAVDSISDSTITKYEWDFSYDSAEGFTVDEESSDPEITREFDSGLYVIKVRITNEMGESDESSYSDDIDLKINYDYEITATIDSGQQEHNVQLYGLPARYIKATLEYESNSIHTKDLDLYLYNTTQNRNPDDSDDEHVDSNTTHNNNDIEQLNIIELDYYNNSNRAWFDESHELGDWTVVVDHERSGSGSSEYTLRIEVIYWE